MPDWLRLTGEGVTLAGALAAVIGAVGVIRFPDIYTRLHAASITDTGGASLVLLGLAIASADPRIALKLLLVWVFVMITSPTASHALANAAFSSGLKPRLRPLFGQGDAADGAGGAAGDSGQGGEAQR